MNMKVKIPQRSYHCQEQTLCTKGQHWELPGASTGFIYPDSLVNLNTVVGDPTEVMMGV